MRFVKSIFPALLMASCFSSVSYATVPDRITDALTSGETVTLRGNVHHKALPQFDQGPVDPAMRLGTMTLLTLPTASQQKALTQLLAQQQDPKSSSYHKWLTPEQFADRFGLSQNDTQQIAGWLKAHGFSLVHVARGRNWISFNGSAAQVQSAFGTEIHHYNVNGELHYANATAPSIPAAVRGIVTGIRGLHDFRPRPRSIRRNSVARPYYNSSNFGDLVAPGDIATIYDINALYNAGIDGTGQKLAVMGQTDIYLADITDFRTGFGLSAISCTTNSSGVITACSDPHFVYKLDGTDPGLSKNGDISEADLDVEWAGATARGAQIIYVNSTDTFTSYYYAVDNTVAPVISLSYGLCEFEDNTVLTSSGQPAADESELMKANAEGITFLNSSGDSGAAECDPVTPYTPSTDPNGASAQGGLAISYPASSPEVTGVGGTAISLASLSSSQYWGASNGTDGGSALSYIPELAWNDDAEFVTYCQQNPGLFCSQGGSPAVPGWVPITTAQNVQTDFSLQGGQGISSTGGGPSNCAQQTSDFSACVSGFPQPSWQKVTVPGQVAKRFSPDVSFLATPNFPGYIFCTQLSELGDSGTGSACAPGGSTGITNALSSSLNSPSIIGGTSVSTPIFAGIVTLLNQYLDSANGLGNINPVLYSLAATSSNGAFHPVTTSDSNNLVYCTPDTPSVQPTTMQCPSSGVLGFQASNADTTTGYNLVTGLGSVDADKLAIAWAATTPQEFTLTPTAASFQVAQGSSIDATVNVTFASGFNGTITFKCTEPSTLTDSTCTAPPQINAAGPVSFHVTTTLPSIGTLQHSERGMRIFYAALLPGLLGIVVTVGSRRSLRGMRVLGLIMVLGISTLWLGSCGGTTNNSNSNPGTPKGTYTITMTGTSGTATAPATFQLVVQ
jgi:subtilase family serine protease